MGGVGAMGVGDNPNPLIRALGPQQDRVREALSSANVSVRAVYDTIRDIVDPEHPYTLEQLDVVREDLVEVIPPEDMGVAEAPPVWSSTGGPSGVARRRRRPGVIKMQFTPTVPHCTMSTLIGLCIRVAVMRKLTGSDSGYKLDVRVTKGSHHQEEALNRQLNDKERVSAALEKRNLVQMVDQCLDTEGTLSPDVLALEAEVARRNEELDARRQALGMPTKREAEDTLSEETDEVHGDDDAGGGACGCGSASHNHSH